ncbi:hypothetical protein B0F90DRAFT_1631373 [Multifurca ochricompacta]|uniref:Uncharacterized protein n=1 Tax=Multifurca ochricompacta TaxID=376703 RepID=A0AAD4M4K1_9AGAM|nr:hypothetical protein B0F90DRAFT_1631373 [Multifurca ochricompacta]
MQTSYALISIYKTRIAALEHALREAGTQRQHPRAQRPGPVEYRKLMQRFKQFLSTEERFWTQLVVRIQRQFALSEARSALATLSIAADTDPDVDDADAGKHDHFRFPPEPVESAPSQLPISTQRNSRRATLSKTLVVLGDLARYREQYNEGSTRPRGGPERGGRTARGRGSQVDLPRAKTYDKARACYECARDLMPDEGNASHQLAILASYQKDTFESLVQYYKALCVRTPYDPAAENMGNVLSKFLEAWKRKRKTKPGQLLSDDLNRQKTNPPSFKDSVILLHALWRLDVEEMDSISPKHDESVVKEFSELVSDRILSTDTITKVIVAAQGALWKQRKVSASASVAMESRIVGHVLALYRALLQSGITELDEAAKIVEEDLAMRITATFRRTLPALRIASKWLRVNLNYVLGDTRKGKIDLERGPVIKVIPAFWEVYTSFATRIVLVFPPTSLPKLTRPLEEDVDARGYLPLGGMLVQDTLLTNPEGDDPRTPEQVHPNEEQLMRIWDIGHDARLIAEISGTPMESFRAQFSLIDSVRGYEPGITQEGAEGEAVAPNSRSHIAVDDRQSEEEDARTETTDPVGDAFREVLGVPSPEDEEEEDEIVWNPRYVN